MLTRKMATDSIERNAMPAHRGRIVFLTTVPETIAYFLSRQIQFLSARGYEVHTVSSPDTAQLAGKIGLPGVRHEVPMRRAMSPLSDVLAVCRLCRLFRRLRPQIVQTHTPKAGFVGMIAAWLARVPIRIYTVNGLPILTQPFWGRLVLAVTEWMSCNLATEVICVSRSVRRFVIAGGFCPRGKARTLGDGGSHGVDIDKFSPAVHGRADRVLIRTQYGIPEQALVMGYVGRMVPDKGIAELALAWNTLRDEFPELRLLLCGYCERHHPLSSQIIERLRSDPRVHFTGAQVTDMPPIYAALDICVLPTYREGLPNVALECGAMQVPIVATRVPGCVDAIRHGVTGLLVEPRNAEALAGSLRYLVVSPDVRARMGAAARRFVSTRFSEERISGLLLAEYRRLVGQVPDLPLENSMAAVTSSPVTARTQ